jgi:hypothetical protein
MSVSSGDEETSGTLIRAYQAGTLYNYSAKQIAGFFGGLELVGPGLVDAREWDPASGSTASPASRDGGRILAGVGRKPLAGQQPSFMIRVV